jgi:branched-chain amino acid transport system substrate-binding protein
MMTGFFRKLPFLLLILVAGMLVLAACGSDDDGGGAAPIATQAQEAPKEPIKIGVIAILTGPFAGTMGVYKAALEWELDRIGRTIAGRPVETIWVDSEGKLDVALSKAKRLIELDKVHAIIGPVHSGVAVGIEQYIGTTAIPWMAPEAGAVSFYPPANAIRTSATSHHFALPRIGEVIAEKFGVKKAIIIGLDYAAGHDIVDATKTILQGGNIEVIQEMFVPLSVTDFGPYISKMDTDEAQLLTGAMFGGPAMRMVNQLHEFGLTDDLRMAFGHAFVLDDFGLADLGDAYVGTLNWFDLPPINHPSAAFQQYAAEYKEQFDVWPGYGWRGLTVVNRLKTAIESIGGNVEDSAAFIAAMKTPFEMPTGTYHVDACNDSVMPVYLKEVKMVDGKPATTHVEQFDGARLPCPKPSRG